MPFIEGRTLAEMIEAEGTMDEVRVRNIGRTLGLALGAVHDASIIHKDVKAHNVMVESGGRLVLIDFGASIRLDDLEITLDAGAVRGTPYYLAPELFEDHAASNQSDIYSLGVLLFHLLTGE